MTTDNYLQMEWESFKEAAVPADAPDYQVRDMQMAFYGGALSVLTTQCEVVSKEETTMKEGVELLRSMYSEVQQFAADVLGVSYSKT